MGRGAFPFLLGLTPIFVMLDPNYVIFFPKYVTHFPNYVIKNAQNPCKIKAFEVPKNIKDKNVKKKQQSLGLVASFGNISLKVSI